MKMHGILERKSSGTLVDSDRRRKYKHPATNERVKAALAPNWSANLQ